MNVTHVLTCIVEIFKTMSLHVIQSGDELKQESFSHVFVNVVEHYRSSVILDCNIILNILRAVVTCHKAGRGSCTHIIQITM